MGCEKANKCDKMGGAVGGGGGRMRRGTDWNAGERGEEESAGLDVRGGGCIQAGQRRYLSDTEEGSGRRGVRREGVCRAGAPAGPRVRPCARQSYPTRASLVMNDVHWLRVVHMTMMSHSEP